VQHAPVYLGPGFHIRNCKICLLEVEDVEIASSFDASDSRFGPARADVGVVIIGAGPAGLAAAAACKALRVRAIVLERGKTAQSRNRWAPEDIGSGVGGAGLFSDGKFSFYPSATRLWQLEPQNALVTAYKWLSDLIKRYGIEAPQYFNHVPVRSEDVSLESRSFRNKQYPSLRMDFAERMRLVTDLYEYAEEILVGSEVVRIRSSNIGVVATTRTLVNGVYSEQNIFARAAIITTGRLGAMPLRAWIGDSAFVYRRLEIGVRIEQRQESFFLRESKTLDPKLILDDSSPGFQWRTFCCCRGGEVVEVLSEGILAVAGRADVEETGLSNVGFHLRITDPMVGDGVCREVLSALANRPKVFLLEVADLSTGRDKPALEEAFGVVAGSGLHSGLTRLATQFDLRQPLTLYGPSVEGIGWYPNVDDSLRIPGQPIWVAGDIGGIFRGLTAALVSGYFTGMQVAQL
jgi:uncharacterized FAD-dependent dehydrogenase